MRQKVLILSSVFFALLTACRLTPIGSSSETVSQSNGTSSNSTSSTSASSSASLSSNSFSSNDAGDDILPVEPTKDDAVPTIPMEEYLDFWSDEVALSFEIDMTKQCIQFMSDAGAIKNDIRNDIYFPADVSLTVGVDEYLIHEVGIRMKGNVYSRGAIAENGSLFAPFGFKLSFNETFDEDYYQTYGLQKSWTATDQAYLARKDRTLFGMEKLDFKWNRSDDPSMITQAFAYDLVRSYLPIAPQSTLSRMFFTTEDGTMPLGVYMVNESIDKTLIRRFFNKAEAQGDLYKCLWPVDLNLIDRLGRHILEENNGVYSVNPDAIGVEDTWNNYHPTYDLKTNKKTSTHQDLIALITTLQEAGTLSESSSKAALEAVVDIPSFLDYAAVSYLIGNPDDMRWNVNNTYLYFHPTTHRAYFIPYDSDWSLGVTWDGGLTDAMGHVTPTQNTSPVYQSYIHNPLYWYTILFENDGNVRYSNDYPRINSYRINYLTKVQTVKNDPKFSISGYTEMFERYRDLYPNIESDLETHSAFSNVQKFESYYNAITATIDTYFASL